MPTECLMPKTFVYYGTKMLAYLIVDSILKHCHCIKRKIELKCISFKLSPRDSKYFDALNPKYHKLIFK